MSASEAIVRAAKLVFDHPWWFGVVAPLVCFSVATVQGMFGLWTLPLDVFAILATTSMAVWLSPLRKSPFQCGWLHGTLLAAFFFALPFAFVFGGLGVVGLVASIVGGEPGVLFLSALALQPALAVPALYSQARRSREAGRRSGAQVLGFLCAVGVPVALGVALHFAEKRAVRLIVAGEIPLVRMYLRTWRRVAPGHEWFELRNRYEYAQRAGAWARANRIADAYERLTGRSIEVSD